MYKYILEQAGDIDWMAIISLLIFFGVFAVSTILILTKSKQHVDRMAQLPLENDTTYSSETNTDHEA